MKDNCRYANPTEVKPFADKRLLSFLQHRFVVQSFDPFDLYELPYSGQQEPVIRLEGEVGVVFKKDKQNRRNLRNYSKSLATSSEPSLNARHETRGPYLALLV